MSKDFLSYLKENDEEQSYSILPDERRFHQAWEELAKSGELSLEELDEIEDEPSLELEASDGIEGLGEYEEPMKTSLPQWFERGIDPKLSSQRQDVAKQARERKAKALERERRRLFRKEAVEKMRRMSGDGLFHCSDFHSVDQGGYSAAQICIRLTRTSDGRERQKELRDAMAKETQQKKKKLLEPGKGQSKASRKEEEPQLKLSCGVPRRAQGK